MPGAVRTGEKTEGVSLMGRGRQKAKATKQAREIKYFTPDTDLTALQRELAQKRDDSVGEPSSSDDGHDDYDDVAERYGS